MDVFNGNDRLQDNIIYALDWAIYLRHNLDSPINPFLFEWKEKELFMNMLEPGGDPEEFAYKVVKKSNRQADQFVVGYEGLLTDESGNKSDAFIIKGYDRTQLTGVFLAQIFKPKEKDGKFCVIDTPMFIGNPELPVELDTTISPNYTADELGFIGMVIDNQDQMGVFTHDNPSVIANGIKRYIRGKVAGENAGSISGNIECTITPNDKNTDFLKYTVLRAISFEKQNEFVKSWEKKTGKQVRINCKFGDEIWLEEFKLKDSKSESNSSKSTEENGNKSENNDKKDINYLKYKSFGKQDLDKEFYRIVSVPNARTNIKCLEEMAALMKVYKEKGIEMPSAKQKPKSGCAAALIVLIVISGAILRFII